MIGAYCPVCRENGPDLVITKEEVVIPPEWSGRRITLTITFVCGACRRGWKWNARFIPDEGPIEYELVGRTS